VRAVGRSNMNTPAVLALLSFLLACSHVDAKPSAACAPYTGAYNVVNQIVTAKSPLVSR
jgi:hypothetical protein